ncbi:Zinc finger protein like [Quillaja saponaria]|nr:Zinc finger protein like [Quillaja saponaria]
MMEAEVRWELMMEREMAMRRPGAEGFSFEGRMAVQFDPRMPLMHPFHNRLLEGRFTFPQPQLLQAVTPEIRPSSEVNKNKLILLAKPESNLSGAKRKTVTPPAAGGNEVAPFGLKKKPKEEWSCAMCQVSASNERGLNEHLHGRKHKSKEAALTAAKMVNFAGNLTLPRQRGESFKSFKDTDTITFKLEANVDKESLQKETGKDIIDQNILNNNLLEQIKEEHLEQENKKAEDLKYQNGTAVAQRMLRTTEIKGKNKFKFFCDMCQVGAISQTSMENHKMGKKHMARLSKNKEQLLRKNRNKEDSRKLNGTEVLEKVYGKTEFKKNKFMFWCEMCEVAVPSQKVMESHKKGKKHMSRQKKISQNNEITQPAVTIASSEATPRAEGNCD